MCLDKITKVYKPNLFNLWSDKHKSGLGWKIVTIKDGKIISRYRRASEAKVLPLNKFINEREYRPDYANWGCLQTEHEINYKYGWHIVINYSDAVTELYSHPQNAKIVKVEYRGGHTEGIDLTFNCPTIVAKYMKILG